MNPYSLIILRTRSSMRLVYITFKERLGFEFKNDHIILKRNRIHIFHAKFVIRDLYDLSSRYIDRVAKGPSSLAKGRVNNLSLAVFQHFKSD